MKNNEQGLVFKTEMRFSIDFKEWRKNPITRKAALRNAWFHGKAGHIRQAFYWMRAAWRGYWSGTIFNAGV